jgi:hypothetical protein
MRSLLLIVPNRTELASGVVHGRQAGSAGLLGESSRFTTNARIP